MVGAARTVQIVLAAGRSERMGSPKALLDFGGRTALELVLRAAGDAGVGESLVVVGAHGAEIRAAHVEKRFAQRLGWVRNDEEGSEQLRSLQLGLEACLRGPRERLDGFFIHPVDHPLATPEDYRLLLAALAGDDARSEVFIPSHGGRRGHPIFCRAAVAKSILELGPRATARDAIEKARIAHVESGNAGVRHDMDTPDEYRKLADAYRARESP